MKRAFFAVTMLPTAALLAHPHIQVDQQAHMSIGRSQIVLVYNITPSSKDGGHIFGHIDTNRDDRLSRSEKRAFALELITRTSLMTDGKSSKLELTHFAFPERQAIAKGRAMIKVRARTHANLAAGSKHRVVVDIKYSHFAESWFVQPFYFADLVTARHNKIVRRQAGSNAVSVTF